MYIYSNHGFEKKKNLFHHRPGGANTNIQYSSRKFKTLGYNLSNVLLQHVNDVTDSAMNDQL